MIICCIRIKKSLLLLLTFSTFAFGYASAQRYCDPAKFKALVTLSKLDTISATQLSTAVLLVKGLESGNCVDYVIMKKGIENVISTRTYLFGTICLKANNEVAIKEYINYLRRNSGSAEEELAYQFEKLFIKQPRYVLAMTSNDKNLLDLLVWGFVNNHYKMHLNAKSYRAAFYKINPKIKSLYLQYQKSIDYLLTEIKLEL